MRQIRRRFRPRIPRDGFVSAGTMAHAAVLTRPAGLTRAARGRPHHGERVRASNLAIVKSYKNWSYIRIKIHISSDVYVFHSLWLLFFERIDDPPSLNENNYENLSLRRINSSFGMPV